MIAQDSDTVLSSEFKSKHQRSIVHKINFIQVSVERFGTKRCYNCICCNNTFRPHTFSEQEEGCSQTQPCVTDNDQDWSISHRFLANTSLDVPKKVRPCL